MNIIHICAEFAPFVKVGGLGDAISGLASTSSQNHQVQVIIPSYSHIKHLDLTKSLGSQTFSIFYEQEYRVTCFQHQYRNLLITRVAIEGPSLPFSRGNVYGYEDDPQRFILFCLATNQYLTISNLSPDIIHIHDWHTSLMAGLLKNQKIFPGKIVLTIHNFDYQGACSSSLLTPIPFAPSILASYQSLKNPLTTVLLKGGLLCSDWITTVSPTYRKEIFQIYQHGEMADSLKQTENRFIGIINGIDWNYWNPETDSLISHNYSPQKDQLNQIISQKKENKKKLLSLLKLSNPDLPLICIISRLVEQKGLLFMKQAILDSLSNLFNIAILGQCSCPNTLQDFSSLSKQTKSCGHVAMILDFNEQLAHQLYAGSDMILVPSLFEPCGLTQLIAMRYGTVPIVRKTGGLADTVEDLVNGFVFSSLENTEEFRSKLQEAIHCYNNDKKTWQSLISRGVSYPCSWDHSSQDYLSLYSKLSSSS